MDFDDRLSWLVVGCLIGFVLGYAAKTLRETHQTAELSAAMTNKESGFIQFPVVANVCLALAMCITLGAAVSTQNAKNRMDRSVICNQKILDELLIVVNARTNHSVLASESNVELQKSQAKMLRTLLHKPPYSERRQDEATKDHFDNLLKFLDLSEKSAKSADTYSYPTVADLEACLNK